ncbi:MAG: hypothetical protein Q7T33_03690 [Dehalococcoidia bacterium]|nr:hypothetical protein [Dehalococcoidia bacterium]
MAKKILLSVFVLGLVGVLAVSGLSALARGNSTSNVSSLPSTDAEDHGPPAASAGQSEEGPDADEAEGELEEDGVDDGDLHDAEEANIADFDVDDGDVEDIDDGDVDDGDEGVGEQDVAQVIADAFGASQEEVKSLHQQGMGFGALFKLYSIAKAKGMSVNDLLAQLTDENGHRHFAFGKLMKSLTNEQLAALEAGPKNVGQLVSASHKPESQDHGQGKSHGNGNGPPDQARALGHQK